MGIRCDAAVAEKGAEEASGEKFEYQAEVGRRFFYVLSGVLNFCYILCFFFRFGLSFFSSSCFPLSFGSDNKFVTVEQEI